MSNLSAPYPQLFGPYGVHEPINDSMTRSQKNDFMCKLIRAIRNIAHLPADVKLDCLAFYADSQATVGLTKHFFINH